MSEEVRKVLKEYEDSPSCRLLANYVDGEVSPFDIDCGIWILAMKETEGRIAIKVLDGLTVEYFAWLDGELKYKFKACSIKSKEATGSEAVERLKGAIHGWSVELSIDLVLIEDTTFENYDKINT